jgi:hypothetical protein
MTDGAPLGSRTGLLGLARATIKGCYRAVLSAAPRGRESVRGSARDCDGQRVLVRAGIVAFESIACPGEAQAWG